LLKFLARHAEHPPLGVRRWTNAYRTWLAELRLDDARRQTVLEEYRQQFAEMEARVARLTARVKAEVRDGPFQTLLSALQCLKGVGPITAVTWVAELGDLTRFRKPRLLMGYSGLTPSEYSSGGRVQRGHITKCGNSHVRFVTIESAWHARWAHQPTSTALKRRREGQPEAVVQIAEQAQQRLGQRYRALLKRGKTSGQAATAVARELVGFVWAIGQAVAAQTAETGAPHDAPAAAA
jgi:transposase